jgi:hypothetical protein
LLWSCSGEEETANLLLGKFNWGHAFTSLNKYDMIHSFFLKFSFCYLGYFHLWYLREHKFKHMHSINFILNFTWLHRLFYIQNFLLINAGNYWRPTLNAKTVLKLLLFKMIGYHKRVRFQRLLLLVAKVCVCCNINSNYQFNLI